MNLTEVAILTIIISGILLGTFTIYEDVASDIYKETNTTSRSVIEFGAITDLQDVATDMEEHMLGLSEKVATFNPLAIYDLSALFVDVGVFLFKLPNVMLNVIEGTTRVITGVSIPGWFSGMILAIISVTVILKIVAIFLKREEI